MCRMMEETSEAEFEKLLSQLREATQEPDPTQEVVEVDEDEALLDVEDDDVVMLEVAADAAPSIAVPHDARQHENLEGERNYS